MSRSRPLHLRISGRDAGGRGERIVRFQLNHRPHDDAHGLQRFLERVELRPQSRFDAVAGLVPAPEIVTEGFDHVIGRDADMRCAFLDHLQYRVEHTDDRAKGLIRALVEAAQAIKVAEQLVGAINKMHDHERTPEARRS